MIEVSFWSAIASTLMNLKGENTQSSKVHMLDHLSTFLLMLLQTLFLEDRQKCWSWQLPEVQTAALRRRGWLRTEPWWVWIRAGPGQRGFSSRRHEASNYLPSSFCVVDFMLGCKDKEKERGREEELWKGGQDEGRRLRDRKRKREWKPSENPYTWFIPVRLCAVGRSYLLFMRASAAKRPDVKLCGDLI